MRIGFIERMVVQTTARKGGTRNAALTRYTLVFGGLGAICMAIWQLAPIEKVMVERRGTEVPLDFLFPAMGLMFLGLAGLLLICRDR